MYVRTLYTCTDAEAFFSFLFFKRTQLSFTLKFQSFSFIVLFSAGRESGRPAREDGGGLEGDHLSPEH